CALKYFQSNAGPKYRFVYLRKVGSYRSLIFFALRAAAARSIAFPAFLTEDCAAATPAVQSDSVTNAAVTRKPDIGSADRAPDDERDGNEQRGDENRDGDIAALELRWKVNFGRESIDQPVAEVHQDDAECGVDQIQHKNRELQLCSSVQVRRS